MTDETDNNTDGAPAGATESQSTDQAAPQPSSDGNGGDAGAPGAGTPDTGIPQADIPVPPRGETIVFGQTASWGGIAPITLLNALLNIVTLSLWRFWGRTRVRRYLWSTTTINGTPLEYTGTGFEIFRSFVFVMLVVFLPIYALFFAGRLMLPPDLFLALFGIAYIPILLAFSWLFGIAVWMARRYRLSRTTWRGIRFGQAGSANGFAWASIGYGLLTAVTMGWYGPAAEMRLTRRLWRETFYGDRPFQITKSDDGLAAPLYSTFALSWLSGVFGYFVFIAVYMALMWDTFQSGGTPQFDLETLAKTYLAIFVYLAIIGLFSLPYAAALLRRKAEILGLEELRFRLDAKFLSLGWIYLGNVLIVIFTLGFGIPFAQMRLWRYIFRRIETEGEIDVEAIRQNADRGPKSGEGLADAFDIGNVI